MTYKSILQIILAHSQKINFYPLITIYFSDRDIEAVLLKVDSNIAYMKRSTIIGDENYFISIDSINGIKIKDNDILIEDIENMIGGLEAFS